MRKKKYYHKNLNQEQHRNSAYAGLFSDVLSPHAPCYKKSTYTYMMNNSRIKTLKYKRQI